MAVPSFFKVLFNDFTSTLRIPTQFVKKFGDILPDDALIETRSGESWSVKIEQIGDHYRFTHGWPKFVKDHQLKRGDFVVFWLLIVGKSIFKVAIFGATGCEKMLNLGTRSYDPINCKPEISELELQSACMCQCHTTTFSTISGSKRGRPRNINKVKNEYLCNDAFIACDSVEGLNPRFDKTLKNYHRSRMPVPLKFAKKAGILTKTSVVLKNPKGQSWCVELKLRKENAILEMVEGWSEFRKKNKLAMGRNCTFEFIPGSDCILVRVLKRGQCHEPTPIC